MHDLPGRACNSEKLGAKLPMVKRLLGAKFISAVMVFAVATIAAASPKPLILPLAVKNALVAQVPPGPEPLPRKPGAGWPAYYPTNWSSPQVSDDEISWTRQIPTFYGLLEDFLAEPIQEYTNHFAIRGCWDGEGSIGFILGLGCVQQEQTLLTGKCFPFNCHCGITTASDSSAIFLCLQSEAVAAMAAASNKLLVFPLLADALAAEAPADKDELAAHVPAGLEQLPRKPCAGWPAYYSFNWTPSQRLDDEVSWTRQMLTFYGLLEDFVAEPIQESTTYFPARYRYDWNWDLEASCESVMGLGRSETTLLSGKCFPFNCHRDVTEASDSTAMFTCRQLPNR
jgi:hypothetical protein